MLKPSRLTNVDQLFRDVSRHELQNVGAGSAGIRCVRERGDALQISQGRRVAGLDRCDRRNLAALPSRVVANHREHTKVVESLAGEEGEIGFQPRFAASVTPFECGATAVTTIGGCGFW